MKPSDTPKLLKDGLGYVRVSTPRQAMQGVSLDSQFEMIRKFAAFKNIEVVGLYGDPGISGKNIEDRPGLQTVLELAHRGKVKHVIVYKLARLGRNILETLGMVYKLDKLGVTVHSVMEEFDTKSPVGKLILAVVAASGEYERDTIIENTIVNMARKRDNGGRVSRYAHLGCRLDGDNVLPDEREQHVIERVQAWRKDNVSFREIRDSLAEMGYLSRTGKPYSTGTLHKMAHLDRGDL